MKVPKARKLKSGTWFIQLRLDGESIPITGKTETQCIHFAELAKAEHRAGKKISRKQKNDLTLGEVIDQYIAKYESVLSPSTIRGYSSARKNRFQSVMDRPVNSISNWQTIINNELTVKSEHTVKNGWGVISAALSDAGYAVPQVKLAKVPVKEMAYLEPEEIKPFLKALEGDKAEIEILLELHGLRESEAMFVVRNNRVNLKRNLIVVNGSLVPNKDHKYVEKKTNKTRSSTREIPIMIPRLAELVRYHQDNSIPIRTHSASALLSHVHKVCMKAGVTDVTNHGLRHTFATLCYSLGLSERAVMELGGWGDTQTMHRIYIRLAARDKAKSENALTQFFKDC